MKIIKSLALIAVLATASQISAMEKGLSVGNIIQDLRDVEESQNPTETARSKDAIASQHGMTIYYLHAAIAARKLKAAQAFIEAGVREVADKQKKFPLEYALEDNFTEGISLLVNRHYTSHSPSTLNTCPLDALKCFYKEKKQITPLESAPWQWIKINTTVIDSKNPERIQPLIDNDLVYVPNELIKFTYTYDRKDYETALKTLILLSSQSKISMSDTLRQTAQCYIIDTCTCHYRDNDLRDVLSTFKMPIENKDLMFTAYRLLLRYKERCMGDSSKNSVLELIKTESPIDLTTDWNSAVAILDEKQPGALERFEDRAYVIFTLYPDMVVDQQTANKIHDTLKGQSGARVNTILNHIYDYTSDDRNPWRMFNPLSAWRMYQREPQQSSRTDYSRLPTSENNPTQSTQLSVIGDNNEDKKDQ